MEKLFAIFQKDPGQKRLKVSDELIEKSVEKIAVNLYNVTLTAQRLEFWILHALVRIMFYAKERLIN